MNNYQKTMARINARESAVINEIENLVSQLPKEAIAKLNPQAKAFLENYKSAFESNTNHRTSIFDTLFGKVGDTITAKEAFEKSGGSIVIDARQLYQWRRKGLNVTKISGEGVNTVFQYSSYDSEKAEEFYAKEKVRREARKTK